MKKILLVLTVLVIVLFVSCNADIQILDENGFKCFQLGWTLDSDEILVQSHEGFIVNDYCVTEIIVKDRALVKNVLNHAIDVRFTYNYEKEWITIDPQSEYEFILEDHKE